MQNPFKTYSEVLSYASGPYLIEEIPSELFDTEDDESLLQFISDNLWEPLETETPDRILDAITVLADSLVMTFNLEFTED